MRKYLKVLEFGDTKPNIGFELIENKKVREK
jgi:hypothetical protein